MENTFKTLKEEVRQSFHKPIPTHSGTTQSSTEDSNVDYISNRLVCSQKICRDRV